MDKTHTYRKLYDWKCNW